MLDLISLRFQPLMFYMYKDNSRMALVVRQNLVKIGKLG